MLVVDVLTMEQEKVYRRYYSVLIWQVVSILEPSGSSYSVGDSSLVVFLSTVLSGIDI